MTDYVRVKDKSTSHEYTVRAEHFNTEAHQRVDKPALDARGEPAAPKYRVPMGDKPAASTGRRTPRKSAQRPPAPAPDPVTPEPDSAREPEPDDGQSTAESEEEIH